MAIHRVKVPDLKYHKGFLNDHALALMTINANSLGYFDGCLLKYRLHEKQVCGIRTPVKNSWADYIYPMDEVYHICIVHEKIARLSFLSFRRLTRYFNLLIATLF